MNKIKKRIMLVKEGKSFSDKLKIFISVLSLGKYKPQVFLENKDGVFFVRRNSADLWMLSTLGEFDMRKYFSLSEGTFLDIGANVGKYSIIISKQIKDKGKVFSFEPEPSNLIALKRNIKLNKAKNITIIPFACSNKKAKLEFYLNENNSGGHSLVNKSNNKISVDADTLDNIIKENNIKNIKLIKIDVEGAEMQVFEGAKETLKKYHPKIIFETDFPGKVFPLLKKLNYEIKQISKRDYFADIK